MRIVQRIMAFIAEAIAYDGMRSLTTCCTVREELFVFIALRKYLKRLQFMELLLSLSTRNDGQVTLHRHFLRHANESSSSSRLMTNRIAAFGIKFFRINNDDDFMVSPDQLVNLIVDFFTKVCWRCSSSQISL